MTPDKWQEGSAGNVASTTRSNEDAEAVHLVDRELEVLLELPAPELEQCLIRAKELDVVGENGERYYLVVDGLDHGCGDLQFIVEVYRFDRRRQKWAQALRPRYVAAYRGEPREAGVLNES